MRSLTYPVAAAAAAVATGGALAFGIATAHTAGPAGVAATFADGCLCVVCVPAAVVAAVRHAWGAVALEHQRQAARVEWHHARRMREYEPPPPAPAPPTPAEREVAALEAVARGEANPEAAEAPQEWFFDAFTTPPERASMYAPGP